MKHKHGVLSFIDTPSIIVHANYITTCNENIKTCSLCSSFPTATFSTIYWDPMTADAPGDDVDGAEQSPCWNSWCTIVSTTEQHSTELMERRYNMKTRRLSSASLQCRLSGAWGSSRAEFEDPGRPIVYGPSRWNDSDCQEIHFVKASRPAVKVRTLGRGEFRQRGHSS